MPKKAKNKDKVQSIAPVKVKKEIKPVSDGFVTLESADKRELECRVNGTHYLGHSIKVEEKLVAGVRETLLNAGFKLK